MNGRGARSVLVGLGIAVVLGALNWAGVGLWLLMCLAIFLGTIAWVLPWYGVRLLDEIILFVRGLFWARDQGRFHSFGGAPLQIEDDGRYVWVDGPGLLRALGRREADDVLAARHAGHWQRSDTGVLMLRVDAVVQYLAQMPGRNEPRIQRLRRYFERDVLYPASRRRERA
jgi:hypothetical protein